MTEKKKWVRPRSMESYPEEILARAREAYMKWAFMDNAHWENNPMLAKIREGAHDDLPLMWAFAYMISEQEKARVPAGVMCHGCGSSWSDERLKEERAKRPELVSCCPERKSRPVYWCEA